MPKNKVVKTRAIEEIKKSFQQSSTGYDSGYLLRKADEESVTNTTKSYSPDSNYYKAMTLFEFDKGVLLINSTPKLYQPFVFQFLKDLQVEYDCSSQSERSLAEVVALNFIRVLDIQKKLAQNSEKVQNRYDIQYIAVLSKELDRAQRHYLTSLEALRALHAPRIDLNIKTNTAIVGNTQAVQVRNC